MNQHIRTSADIPSRSTPEIVVGEGADGQVYSWHPRQDPHLLLVGHTGTGYQNVQRQVVKELARQGQRVTVLAGVELEHEGPGALGGLENVRLVPAKLAAQAGAVRELHDVMTRRYELLRAMGTLPASEEPLFLVVCQYELLRMHLATVDRTGEATGNSSQQSLTSLLTDLVVMGRSFRIHLVVGAQRPPMSFLYDGFWRISLGALSAQAALMLWGNSSVDAVGFNECLVAGSDAKPVKVRMSSTWIPELAPTGARSRA